MERKKPNIHKVIFVRKAVLLSRIDAETGLVAKGRRKENGLINQDLRTSEGEYRFLINDWIDHYLEEAKARMAAYVINDRRDAQMDYSDNWQEKEIHLSMPWYWKETTFVNLSKAISKYIIDSVLHEFYSLTLSPSDPLTQGKLTQADDAYNNIKHYCLSSHPHSVNKKPYPF